MNCSENTKRRVKRGCPINLRPIVKYAVLTAVGILLFRVGAAIALAERGYSAIGGEVFALFIPVFYWIFAKMIRDFIEDLKKERENRNDPL